MVKTLRKVFSSRVGSDDKIARLASPTDQWDSATAGHHWASVEQLRQELPAGAQLGLTRDGELHVVERAGAAG